MVLLWIISQFGLIKICWFGLVSWLVGYLMESTSSGSATQFSLWTCLILNQYHLIQEQDAPLFSAIRSCFCTLSWCSQSTCRTEYSSPDYSLHTLSKQPSEHPLPALWTWEQSVVIMERWRLRSSSKFQAGAVITTFVSIVNSVLNYSFI